MSIGKKSIHRITQEDHEFESCNKLALNIHLHKGLIVAEHMWKETESRLEEGEQKETQNEEERRLEGEVDWTYLFFVVHTSSHDMAQAEFTLTSVIRFSCMIKNEFIFT